MYKTMATVRCEEFSRSSLNHLKVAISIGGSYAKRLS